MATLQSSPQIVRYSDASGFPILRPYWNALLHTTGVDDPFLSWEWQSTWWKNYGDGVPLWLLAAWENKKLVGILPLMQACYSKRGLKAQGLRLIGNDDIDLSGIIVPESRPDILEAFGSYLSNLRQGWKIIRLNSCLAEGQNLEPFFRSFKSVEHITLKIQELPHLYIPLDADWERCRQCLPGKLKRKVRSKLMSLKFDHSYSIVHLMGDEITEDHLQDFFSIGLQGHFPYLYKNVQDRQFHRDLVANMGEDSRISLNMLYIEGVPAAYHYGFIHKQKYHAWRTAFIPQFLEYAPGHIILNETLEYFCKQGIREFDFLRGDARYKREWTNQTRLYHDWQIVKRWSLCALLFVRFANWREKLSRRFEKKRQAETVVDHDY